MAPLTPTDRAVLDFAGRYYRLNGARAEAMLVELGMNETRFWATVNVLIHRPEALAYAPSTVKRLLRLQEQRLAARSMRGMRAG